MSRLRAINHILELANAEDERRQRRHRILARRRANRLLRAIDPFTAMTNEEFVKTFRLTKEAVRELEVELRPHLHSVRRDSLTVMHKILIALCFYASGSYQTLVGQNYFIFASQSSVSRAIRQVTKALNTPAIFHKHVKWPMTSAERSEIKSGFYNKFGFPGVLGCIDGSQVVIIRPKENEERYVCRKGYHSLNVMIICDVNMKILCVDASSPGSTHDSRVWSSHPLKEHIKSLNEQVYLLGDSGYPLRRNLMVPLLDTQPGTPEHKYYEKFVQARCTVERCIGVLKARFRCLLMARALHYSPTTAGKVVNACAVLHNIALRSNIEVEALSAEEVQRENQLGNLMAHELLAEDVAGGRVNAELQEGRAMQRALVSYLWRNL